MNGKKRDVKMNLLCKIKVLTVLILLLSGLVFITGCSDESDESDKSGWQVVGSKVFSSTVTSVAGSGPSLFVYEGIIYAAYMDDSLSGKITVMKYDGRWSVVGSPGISDLNSCSPSLYVYNGVPYVAYTDGSCADKVTVKKYEGGSWQVVGSQGFSAGRASPASLFFNNSEPYVAYQDYRQDDDPNDGCVTVKKFTEGNWVTVGVERFSPGGASMDVSLFIENGIPYIAYDDFPGYTVMKFIEGAWQLVGKRQFSTRGAYLSFFVSDGVPFVSYEDYENSDKATVMKFDGTDWLTVGNAGFTPESTQFTSISVSDGVPYVASTGSVSGGQAIVMKYENEVWQTVGEVDLSDNPVRNICIFIDKDTIYVAYVDSIFEPAYGTTIDKITVMTHPK